MSLHRDYGPLEKRGLSSDLPPQCIPSLQVYLTWTVRHSLLKTNPLILENHLKSQSNKNPQSGKHYLK